jgi:anti-anti-sigma regulatory factor
VHRNEDGWLLKARRTLGGTALRVVAPRVPLDGANTQVLCSLLAPFLQAGRPCRLTLVLGNVTCVSGLALRVLALLHARLSAGGGRLALSDPPGAVDEDAQAMGLTQALNVRRHGVR